MSQRLAVARIAGLVVVALCATLLQAQQSVAEQPPEASYVRAIDWDSFGDPGPADPNATKVSEALSNAARYAVTTWWNTRYADQTTRYLDLGGVGEASIRRPASEAYALAVALNTGSYDPAATGVTADQATAMAIRLATSVAHHHRATTAGGWGDQWQSALWAYYAGNAAWLLWNNLDQSDRSQVSAMLVHESDRFLEYLVPYYRRPDGTVQFPGDSKAEENAWNANLLQLTTAMMPRHPHHAQWMAKNNELMISAFARPSDVNSARVVNGRAVKDWLNGSNIAEDGTLVNHGFVHPDYMATVSMNTSGPMTYSLAGQPVPEASRFNADIVYASMTNVTFPSPPYRPPGGTIYVRDESGEASEGVYYPQGNDWGTHRRAHLVVLDASAHLFGFDSGAALGGDEWERQHVQTLLDMQARGADGRTYQQPGEDTYNGREEWVAVEIARAQLAHWLSARDAIDWTNRAYPQLNVRSTAPDMLAVGGSDSLDVTLQPSDPPAAVKVGVSVVAPSGVTVEAEGPTFWTRIAGGESSATRFRLNVAPDAEPGPALLTVRTNYQMLGVQHEAVTRISLAIAPSPPDGTVWLSDVDWFDASNGYDQIHRDTNLYGDPLSVEGTQYEKGLWTGSPAQISYFLDGECSQLTGEVGIDDSMDVYNRGTVVFQVYADGIKAFDSGLMNGHDPARAMDIVLDDVDVLRLAVTDGGDGKSYDHADWGNMRLTC